MADPSDDFVSAVCHLDYLEKKAPSISTGKGCLMFFHTNREEIIEILLQNIFICPNIVESFRIAYVLQFDALFVVPIGFSQTAIQTYIVNVCSFYKKNYTGYFREIQKDLLKLS